jgi:hypothetical protein
MKSFTNTRTRYLAYRQTWNSEWHEREVEMPLYSFPYNGKTLNIEKLLYQFHGSHDICRVTFQSIWAEWNFENNLYLSYDLTWNDMLMQSLQSFPETITLTFLDKPKDILLEF